VRRGLNINDCHEVARARGGWCLEDEYKNAIYPMKWKCKCGREWKNNFNNVKNKKQWCPRCSSYNSSFKFNLKMCQEYAQQRGGKCLSPEYKNARTSMKWKCGECDSEWMNNFDGIRRKGQWCPRCARARSGIKKRFGIKVCKKYAQQRGGKCLSPEYKNAKTKILWECASGHRWEAIFSNVKKGHWCNVCADKKRAETLFKNYGVRSPCQNREIAIRVAKSSNKSTILKHWKTEEEIVCTASYEKAVVEYFNKNKIDFEWQIRFDIPNGKKYFIDAYLPQEDIYIEIKGYMREHSLKKWNWFHEEYPNSELWNKEKLKEMRIL